MIQPSLSSPHIKKAAGSYSERLGGYLIVSSELISFFKVNVQSAAPAGSNTQFAIQYNLSLYAVWPKNCYDYYLINTSFISL
jgi:hypothetical protein